MLFRPLLRALAAGFVLLGVIVAIAVIAPGASASVTTTTEPLPEVPNGVNSILGPTPGQGSGPRDAGDRGGWAQLGLFAVILAAIGLIVWFVRRDMRRARERRDLST